jgi:hypothetical protein
VIERVAGSGGEVVQAPAHEPGREAPQRHVVDQIARPALRLPSAARDRHRDDHGDRIAQPIDVERERPELKYIRRRTRDRSDDKCHTKRMTRRVNDVS